MRRKKKIPKRDEQFQKSLLYLPNDWLENYESLTVIGKINYALAGQWRPEIYYTQRDLLYSLIMAYTNNHKNVHNKISRRAIKEYHLTFGFVLLPACWDKLAQLLREFLAIKKWIQFKDQRNATEDNTNMQTLIDYLNFTKSNPQINSILKKYWDKKEREDSYNLANQIKHKWSQHYVGIKTKTSDRIKISRNSVSFSFGDKPVDEKVLYKDISLLEKANNSFVKCAIEVDKIINFNQFFKTENGIKTLLL